MPRGIIILAAVTILSVAVNLFLAGDIFGHRFRGLPPPMDIERRLEGMWRDMPEADRPIALSILQQHHDAIISRWNALRPANQSAAAEMRSDPFVADLAKHAFDNTNQRLTEFRAAVQDTIIDIASKVSPEGRKHLRVPGGGFEEPPRPHPFMPD